MSLLIDALKKYQQNSAASPAQNFREDPAPRVTKKYKTILWGIVGALVLVSLTSALSFFVMQSIVKKRLQVEVALKTHMLRQQVPEKLRDRLPLASASQTADDAGEVRARFQENRPSMVATPAPEIDQPERTPPPAEYTENRALEQPRQARRYPLSPSSENAPNMESLTSTEVSMAASTEEASSAPEPSVGITAITDETGENNPVYQHAWQLVNEKKYNQALGLLIENDPVLFKTKGLSALLAARVYLTLGKYALAEETLEHALAVHAGAELALLELKAQVYFMQQRYTEALAILSLNSPSLSDYPEYYALLANVYLSIEQPANAASVFQQIVAKFPNSAAYWLGLALAYQKLGEVDSALVAYRRAAQMSQEDPQVSLFIQQQLEILQSA